MLRKILSLVYLVVGLVVASSHHYFLHLNRFKPIVSSVLAVLLWPRPVRYQSSHQIELFRWEAAWVMSLGSTARAPQPESHGSARPCSSPESRRPCGFAPGFRPDRASRPWS